MPTFFFVVPSLYLSPCTPDTSAWGWRALCLPYVFTLSFIPPSPCTLFWEGGCRGSLLILTFSYLKIGAKVCGAGNARVGYWLLRDVSSCVACVPVLRTFLHAFILRISLFPCIRITTGGTDIPLSVSFFYVTFSLISLQMFPFLICLPLSLSLSHLSHIRNIPPFLTHGMIRWSSYTVCIYHLICSMANVVLLLTPLLGSCICTVCIFSLFCVNELFSKNSLPG